MRLGTVKSVTLFREVNTMIVEFTGGIPFLHKRFATQAELLEEYDRLVEIDEGTKKHVEA